MVGSVASFATFWAGSRMSAFEVACLSSFVRHGYSTTVYSYRDIENLPTGVSLRSASEIVEEKYTSAFLIKGIPSLSHFSDLFRYRLFQATDEIWVDSDMYLLRPFDFELPATLLARETERSLCGAIMRLDRNDAALHRLVQQTEAVAGRELTWGATGPRLLTTVFGPEVVTNAYGPELFFPAHYDEFWKVFLPRFRSECEAKCRDASTIHLWNNIVTKMGVWKDVMPPSGSYLHHLFSRDGMDAHFQGVCPADVMENMVDNYRMRMSGSFGDVKKLARLAVPGVKRRALRRFDWLRDQVSFQARPVRRAVSH